MQRRRETQRQETPVKTLNVGRAGGVGAGVNSGRRGHVLYSGHGFCGRILLPFADPSWVRAFANLAKKRFRVKIDERDESAARISSGCVRIWAPTAITGTEGGRVTVYYSVLVHCSRVSWRHDVLAHYMHRYRKLNWFVEVT